MRILNILLVTAAIACNSPFTPRPEGYFKATLPNKAYQEFNEPGYPYKFEYPVYATIVKDTSFFEDKPENPWWLNIDFQQLNARVHLSYKAIGPNKLDRLVNDAFNLTFKHTYKATSIVDSPFINNAGIYGVYFKVGGNAATANQFFITDSANHFLRGALYFDTTPNEDSLAPMNAFIKEDLFHFINSFRWK